MAPVDGADVTAGQRMVWAAVFADARGERKSVVECVRLATLAVKDLQSLAVHLDLLDEDRDARVMLICMLKGKS